MATTNNRHCPWARVLLIIANSLLLLSPTTPIAAFSSHTTTTTTTTQFKKYNSISLALPQRPLHTTSHHTSSSSPSSLHARPPTYNKSTSLWEPSPDTEPTPYGPFGSFLRGGPTPFLLRLLAPSQYDQAVFKYMASDASCSRAEAQGNMDAYFNNAADWAYQKGEEKRGAPKVDYTVLKPKQAILVVSWAVFVTPFLGRCAYLIGFTDAGWGVSLEDIFTF